MTSIIKVDEIQNKAGSTTLAANKLPDMLSGSAKTYVNFTSISSTSIRKSLNVSSLTDNATGQTTINMTSAMSDTNYTGSWFTNANSGSAIGSFSNQFTGNFILRTTTNYQVASFGTSTYVDALHNDSIIFGDLA